MRLCMLCAFASSCCLWGVPVIRLDDKAMQHYLTEGYVTVQTDFPDAFHQSVYDQAQEIYAAEGNPGNEIYPRIPELGDVFEHPRVRGALSAILGHDYVMHPHRHGHLNPPGKDSQDNHNDSYEDDENVRHHRSRWAMAFYYPQDVDDKIGPTAVTPGSQYFVERESLEELSEKKLCGLAGSVTIVHYDVWHRASENRTNRNRFMMKFLFCRMSEPSSPAWDSKATGSPQFDRHGSICGDLWRWNTGQASAKAPTDSGKTEEFRARFNSGTEQERLEASYELGEAGEVDVLVDFLLRDTKVRLEMNLETRKTNPCQVEAIYGLTVAGTRAVPALNDALTDRAWWVRAAAADTLGDIGLPASPAIPALTDALEDESEWVRRNATEAVGNLQANSAIEALIPALRDENGRVQHNAALSLAKMGPAALSAVPALNSALEDENRYVRGCSRLALNRIKGIQTRPS